MEDIKNMKIRFESLTFEITRKCQLRCDHCFRGEAQNVDISNEILQSLLSQTYHIETVEFIGGEPFLNLEGLKLFLTYLIEKNIRIDQVIIESNGFIKTSEICDILIDYYNYILQWNDEQDYIKRKAIYLLISADRYHIGYNSYEAYSYYVNAFIDYPLIKVSINTVGEYPVRLGRAKKIDVGYDYKKPLLKKVEYITLHRKDIPCSFRDFYQNIVENENQVFIPCRMYISAKGDLFCIPNNPYPYDEMDNAEECVICNVLNKNIMEGIIEYNSKGIKLLCLPYSIWEIQNKKSNRKAMDENIIDAIRKSRKNPFSAPVFKYECDFNYSTNDLLNQWTEFKNKYRVDCFGNGK